MKDSREQRFDIDKHVYDGELTVEEAAAKYELTPSSSRAETPTDNAERESMCQKNLPQAFVLGDDS